MKNTKYHIDLGDRKDVMSLYQSSDDKAIEVALALLQHAIYPYWSIVYEIMKYE